MSYTIHKFSPLVTHQHCPISYDSRILLCHYIIFNCKINDLNLNKFLVNFNSEYVLATIFIQNKYI